MASTNPDSMTNAQGEFHPSKPRDQPMETSGHQVGQQVGNDAAPEFHAKILPAGSAPPSKTFQPNPVNETPGQANNELSGSMQGKEDTRSAALDMPGATSADVQTGYGHPGQGQSSSELRHDGVSKREKQSGVDGQELGGSGLTGEMNAEFKSLQKDHAGGPNNAREHNASLEGAESKEPVGAEQLASEGDTVKKRDYDRTAETAPGKHS